MQFWAIGRYDLRLRETEFWRLSPGRFSALLERRDVELRQQDAYFGTLAAQITNTTRGPGQPLAKPTDFFGSSPGTTRQSPAEMRALLSGFRKQPSQE